MLRLLFLLSTACIAWGVLTSSYFGLKLAPSNFLTEISPLHYLIERKADYHLAVKDDVYHSWLAKFPKIATAQTGEEMLLDTAVVKKLSLRRGVPPIK
jgi:V/A-type H+-transporting ATPase subunit I